MDSQTKALEKPSEIVVGFLNKVYLWITFGILLTAITAYVTSALLPRLFYVINYSTFQTIYISLIIGQLILVVLLSIYATRMSKSLAIFSYLFYTFTVGLTFSFVFYAYTQENISFAFFITAFSFAGLSAFGYFTKKDLSFVGKFCMMGLFGLIGFMIYALFVPAALTEKALWMTGAVGIIVFAGLTAYDTQKLRMLALQMDNTLVTQMSILGALILYLDFINLFLSILRVMGGRK